MRDREREKLKIQDVKQVAMGISSLYLDMQRHANTSIPHAYYLGSRLIKIIVLTSVKGMDLVGLITCPSSQLALPGLSIYFST